MNRFIQKLINISYHYLYYKHTSKHKKELKDVRDRVMKKRFELIGK